MPLGAVARFCSAAEASDPCCLSVWSSSSRSSNESEADGVDMSKMSTIENTQVGGESGNHKDTEKAKNARIVEVPLAPNGEVETIREVPRTKSHKSHLHVIGSTLPHRLWPVP